MVLLVSPLLAACTSPLEAPGHDATPSETPEIADVVPTPAPLGADSTILEVPEVTHPTPTPGQIDLGTEQAPHLIVSDGPIQHEIMPTRNHVAEGVPVTYNSLPPTSGDHWPRWSRCGFFPVRIPDERLVHNLEHGNIVVSFNLTSSEEVGQLRKALEDIEINDDWGIGRSYDLIPPGTVALTAWGVSDTMTGINPRRIRSFFESFAGEVGPERIPCSESGVSPPGMGRPS